MINNGGVLSVCRGQDAIRFGDSKYLL